ncbi:GNAT family N-acetyltransferase [Flavobacterium lindanitolerans]|nr:GNAT family N-acetyltransferase [Flavobacterium lindanitolerans]
MENKAFKALSLDELYDLLELRTEVFIVEQNCVYQDIDNKDRKAIHLIGEFDGETVAYCRLFKAGDYFDESSIGRVIVKEKYRDRKWGHDLIREAIKAIKDNFDEEKITISAQLYLKKFYESHEFSQTSEEYLEDGIPHIEMKRS